MRDGQPWQLVDPPPAAVELPVVELPARGWQQVVTAEVGRPFRLATEPGFRWWLGRLADDDHVLVLTCHHIVSDGWSVGILTADLNARPTAGPRRRPGRAAGTAGAAGRLRDLAAPAPGSARCRAGVLDRGAGRAAHPAAARRPTPAGGPTGAGAGLGSSIDPATAAGLTGLAARLQVSPLAVLLAGFSTVLHRYTGQADLPIGSIFSGRTRTELEPLVGYFANTVVLRTRICDQASGTSHIQHCHTTILAALQHQDTPFSLLVDSLRPPRVPGQNPLFQVSLSLLPASLGAGLRLGDLAASGVGLTTSAARFDMALQVAPQADGSMSVWVEYSTELFDAGRIERLLSHFTAAIAELVGDPSRPLNELLALEEGQRELVDGPFRTGIAAATVPGPSGNRFPTAPRCGRSPPSGPSC